MNPERRRWLRYSFIAHAKVTDISSETTVNARLSELSLHGCYMDMINPLPFDTVVQIEITHDGKVFTTSGAVIYSQPHMGMGVAFRPASPENQAVLEAWIQELGN